LWEAFLIQMNDFDRFLEFELRQLLDPVVNSGAPRRRGRAKGLPLLTIVPTRVEKIVAVETVVVPTQPALLLP
jgi:hypothetical protein